MNKTLDFDFSVKELSSSGGFTGYGSVFGVKDSYDEVVLPGAFRESLDKYRSMGRMPAMLWQHKSAEPLGAFTSVNEDDHGLLLEGQLAMDTVRGAEAYSLLKMKAISGLSIGYQVPPGGDSYDSKTGINTLKKLDLYEVSLVTFPANDYARVQGVKSIELIEDLKSAEKLLRDAGFSRKEAVTFISRIKKLSAQSDSDVDEIKEICNLLRRA